MFKKYLLGLAAVITVASEAQAGGVAMVEVAPVVMVAAPVPYDWSGAYVGAMAGTNSSKMSTGDITTTDDPPIVIPGINYSADGRSLGLEAGYNFQSKNMVYGVEIDASKASIDGSLSNFLDDGQGTNFSVSTSADWIGSARGRFGIASDRTLFYVTGGLAAVGLETHLTDTYDGGDTVFTPSVSETRMGWVAGAGVEFMFRDNWSMKVEYMHYDFGSDTESFVEGTDRTISTDATYDDNQARIGFNYHF